VTSLGSSLLEQPAEMRTLGYTASMPMLVEKEYAENQMLLVSNGCVSCGGKSPQGTHLSERRCENFRCEPYSRFYFSSAVSALRIITNPKTFGL